MTAVGSAVQSRQSRVVRGGALVVGGVWWVLPLVPLALWSVAERWAYPSLLPTRWGWDAWRDAAEQGIVPALFRSLGLAFVVALLATPAGAAAGRALALHAPRFARPMAILLLLPVAIPPLAIALGLNVAILRLQLPPVLGVTVALVALALPYTTFVMYSAYAGYALEYEESARTLGAGRLAVLTRVHLPMVSAALATAAFLAFLVAWSDYIVTVVVGGGRFVTAPMVVGSLASGSGTEALVAAASVAAILPPVILLLVVLGVARRGVRR